MKTTKTVKKITVNPWAHEEILTHMRDELRKTLAETSRVKWELKKMAETLKKNKAKSSQLHRMVSNLEKEKKEHK